jgi:hypothetical protein
METISEQAMSERICYRREMFDEPIHEIIVVFHLEMDVFAIRPPIENVIIDLM